jgi:hypothetical protein
MTKDSLRPGKLLPSASEPFPDGHVKEIHVVNSLSPSLDKTMVDMVHPLKFKRCLSEPLCSDGNSSASLEDLRLEFVFRATCNF